MLHPSATARSACLPHEVAARRIQRGTVMTSTPHGATCAALELSKHASQLHLFTNPTRSPHQSHIARRILPQFPPPPHSTNTGTLRKLLGVQTGPSSPWVPLGLRFLRCGSFPQSTLQILGSLQSRTQDCSPLGVDVVCGFATRGSSAFGEDESLHAVLSPAEGGPGALQSAVSVVEYVCCSLACSPQLLVFCGKNVGLLHTFAMSVMVG